jgi:periodic tryptophan protein 1
MDSDDDDLKEYDLEHYDSDEVDEDGEKITMFGNVKSLAYHQPNEEDPYLVVPEDEEDEEREELQILPTDNLLLAGKVEDEVAHLEVYVYEDEADNLYVHHDIMLPAIPLCLEWLDFPVGKSSENGSTTGNFVAVGTMEPDIEVWDLDVVDSMYPNAILGQGGADADTDAKKPKKKKKVKANDEFHVDSVLALAANRQHRNLLASGSADRTVKLWDLNTAKSAKSYSHHTDKVCSLDWHPKESTVLLTGSYDRTIVAADMRAPDSKARWGVDADVETVRWDIHDPNYFYATTDAGMVYRYDIRNVPATPKDSKPVWSLQAHDSSVSSFDINPAIPGFLATGSTDKQVKLWNVENDKPSMVVSRKLEVGKVFSTTFAPDAEVGFRLAVAGSKGTVQIWDTSTNAAVRRAFVSRLPSLEGEVQERMVGMQPDQDESDDDGAPETGAAGGADGWESMDED